MEFATKGMKTDHKRCKFYLNYKATHFFLLITGIIIKIKYRDYSKSYAL